MSSRTCLASLCALPLSLLASVLSSGVCVGGIVVVKPPAGSRASQVPYLLGGCELGKELLIPSVGCLQVLACQVEVCQDAVLCRYEWERVSV